MFKGNHIIFKTYLNTSDKNKAAEPPEVKLNPSVLNCFFVAQ